MTKIIISSLKNQAAFDLANKIGKKQSGRFFLMISHMNEPSQPNSDFSLQDSQQKIDTSPSDLGSPCFKETKQIHLGLKISKKIGKAVVRNKIRRRLKSLIHLAAADLPEQLWISRVFVIIPRKGLDLVKYSELKKEFIKHMRCC